jgi:hypothetical protein
LTKEISNRKKVKKDSLINEDFSMLQKARCFFGKKPLNTNIQEIWRKNQYYQ